jgi:hypothetical protein
LVKSHAFCMKLTKVGQFLERFHAESSQKCLGSVEKVLGSGRVGSGRVGSGRVGSGRVGSVRVGSKTRFDPGSNLTGLNANTREAYLKFWSLLVCCKLAHLPG